MKFKAGDWVMARNLNPQMQGPFRLEEHEGELYMMIEPKGIPIGNPPDFELPIVDMRHATLEEKILVLEKELKACCDEVKRLKKEKA